MRTVHLSMSRKNKVNRTLNRFDDLPAQKHIRSLGHDVSHYSLIIVRPSFLWSENDITCIVLSKSRFLLCIGCFSVMVYQKPFSDFFN